MDEDLLYLRLIALRSLAEENKTGDAKAAASGDTDTNLAREMKELLEEAEDAANENSDKVETGKAHLQVNKKKEIRKLTLYLPSQL